MSVELATDCKCYRGDRPCDAGRRCRCEQYDPMGTRILIIKLGALGDVVRTVSLLETLKRRYPSSHVTWVSRPNGVRILAGHPLIDLCLPFGAETNLTVTQQRFDLVLSLDKEPGPAALCNAANCPDKRGIRLSRFGTVEPCNEACEPYFLLGLDDELKFNGNDKSYPRLIHEALELPYRRRPYRLYPDPPAKRRAEAMFTPWRAQAPGPMVGLNTGAGSVFANKVPQGPWWADLAGRLVAGGHGVVLLGGPDEEALNTGIAERVGPGIHRAGSDNTEMQFVAVVDQCDAVVAGDTLALHVAIARRVPVVALFGPTCHQEIDLFDLGRKIISTHACGPCYRRRCETEPSCTDAIAVEEVLDAVEALCRRRAVQRVAL